VKERDRGREIGRPNEKDSRNKKQIERNGEKKKNKEKH